MSLTNATGVTPIIPQSIEADSQQIVYQITVGRSALTADCCMNITCSGAVPSAWRNSTNALVYSIIIPKGTNLPASTSSEGNPNSPESNPSSSNVINTQDRASIVDCSLGGISAGCMMGIITFAPRLRTKYLAKGLV